jgi:ribosome-binding protein aMBF1 (putative translation factor)
MSRTLANSAATVHRISLEEVRPEMAKAEFKKVENVDFRAQIGRVVGRALAMAGLSQKEAAGEIGCDVAQMARWVAGTERPQFDRLFAVEALREPLCVALAQMAGATVHQHVEFRRKVG